LILVAVGTHAMPFDRLVQAVDAVHAAAGFGDPELVVQSGCSTHVCGGARQFAYCPGPEFTDLLERADLLISHGGIGTILPALRLGKRVIAIPRLKRYGEHNNDHQVEVCAELGRRQILFTSRDTADLPSLLSRDPADLQPLDQESTIVSRVRDELLTFAQQLRDGRRRGNA